MEKHVTAALASIKNVHVSAICTSLLVLFLAGHSLAAPATLNEVPSLQLHNVKPSTTESSTSTLEVLRNIQKILSIGSKSHLPGHKRKLAKQETTGGAEAEGSANALAYLTDSFGGQLAGQILSVILSSVTGDVRGILGNSLNLFQTDERRDRVQIFLDEISQNFLKITGLQQLTMTTQSPLGAQGQQGQQVQGAQSLLVGPGGGNLQILNGQGVPVTSLGGGNLGVGNLGAGLGGGNLGGGNLGVGSLGGGGLGGGSLGAYGGGIGGGGLGGGIGGGGGLGGGIGGVGSLGGGSGLAGGGGTRVTQLQQQQKPQQVSGGQQPIIYVLPNLSQSQSAAESAGSSASSSAAKPATTGNTKTADEDSEEDIERKLFR